MRSLPARIHRNSKGTKFAWFVDRMKDGITINDRPDHVAEHGLYLHLTEPIRLGTPYTIEAAKLFEGGPATFTFDPRASRSATLHANTIGYVPGAPHKFAYLYQWTGDGGALDLSACQGKPFHLIETASGDLAFSGTIAFRMPKTNQGTYHQSDFPTHGNFLNADVAVSFGAGNAFGITLYGATDPARNGGFCNWAYIWVLGKWQNLSAFAWPDTEAFCDVYMWPAMTEYTVRQTVGPASYYWGFLSAR